MSKEELVKHAELELQWLRYYANEETRRTFDPTKSPYDQLVSIGYTKRVLPLQYRCVFVRLTSDISITDSAIEDIIESNEPRVIENNVYSALEVLLMKCPEEHDWVTKYLQ